MSCKMHMSVSTRFAHPRLFGWHADDPQADKLLLVMEYAEAGPVMRGDRSTEKVPLAEGVALKFFRDVLQVRTPSQLYHSDQSQGSPIYAVCTWNTLVAADARLMDDTPVDIAAKCTLLCKLSSVPPALLTSLVKSCVVKLFV